MTSQFVNGQPPQGPPQPGYRYPGPPNQADPFHNPQVPSKPFQQGPPGGPNQYNQGPTPPPSQWGPPPQSGPPVNKPYNPNQLPMDMNNMHISGPGGAQWPQQPVHFSQPPVGPPQMSTSQHGPPPSSSSQGLLSQQPQHPPMQPSHPPLHQQQQQHPPPPSSIHQQHPPPPQQQQQVPGMHQQPPPPPSSQFPPQQQHYPSQPPLPGGPPLPGLPSSLSGPPPVRGASSFQPPPPTQQQQQQQLPQHPQMSSSMPPMNQFNVKPSPYGGVPPPTSGGAYNQPYGNLPPPPPTSSPLPLSPPQNQMNNPQMNLSMGNIGNAPNSYPDGHPYGAPPPPLQHQPQPGFPPSTYPGQPQRPPDMGGYGGPPNQFGGPGGKPQPPYLNQPSALQQPARKLDPDQMPSQIQVLEDDKLKNGGVYVTGQRGAVPPLVTSNFIVDDQGTCSPRFLRSTMYSIPCTADLLKQSHLPFVITLSPFAKQHPKENKLPITDLGQMGPVRCNRCKAYMCPYMMFIDGGRKFQCCFCNCSTEVPPEYFAHLDHTGKRIDCFEKPELCLGAYEFVATADYCKDNKLPQAPAFIFMIDVSFSSVSNGLINLLCSRLKKDILAYLPIDEGDTESEVRVGFVTYSNELHFYNIKNTLVQPQMLVVTDMNDVFVPLVDGFLVKVSEAEAIIDSLLAQIWSMFSDNCEKESILGPAIQAGLDALKSAERSGKLIIFHSSMPTLEAPGKLKNREDRNLLGSDKEKTLLTPQTNFYTKLGQECVGAGCSVDIFLFPNVYIDVATIAEVPRLTGGTLYKYNYFKADTDGDMLISDLRTNITRQVAFDVVLRLRTSTGIRAVDFFGNFYMSNTTDVELASLDQDKAISIEIRHDDKLTEAEGAFAQAAVLYTSVGGRRRLRVLNSSFNCCTQINDLFRSCELDVIINFLAKQGIRESLNSNVKQVREHLTNQCVQILASYRKNCANPSSTGQLILPECMKLLPVYINSLIKSGIFQTENINVDDRSYYINQVNAMNISSTVAYFYPRLVPLLDLDVNSTCIPQAVRCSYERLKDNGAYLLENGLVIFLWVGLSINAEWIQQVFGVPSVAQVDIDKTKLQDLDNPLSVRVREMVKKIREERQRHMKLVIVRQRDKMEPVMQMYMVEDRTPLVNCSLTYVDFLCHIHKEIRNILV